MLANTIEEEFHIQLDYEVLPGLDSFDLILDCLKRKVHGSKSQIQFERNESTKKQKTNLLLFLTPYIIRDQGDYRRILKESTAD